ncbi:MNIO family bufferin maturase [Caballeronia sordidicola]|uniref:UPF0276 protein PAMC26510_16625 n=1 Tax=Caballeronia sordidicola TaxID=196367 RepID=A0A2C9XXF1_CABSO|nr:DUF692 domain-containing protein [Caballeronia sordidicola]OTP74397.1 hypothetical protein PAMC26510_16625 [Caballeronia sordidicola]
MIDQTTYTGAGVGFKPIHFEAALACTEPGLWYEVHPENYMVDGGPRLALLEAIRARRPVSLHGVSLSLAADCSPDSDHLKRLKSLANRIEPALVSEHLAWSTWRGQYHPDLLPFPRSHEALARVCGNIEKTQEVLARRIAIENPTHYGELKGHDWGELDFFSELTRRTGCGILLDVNNVYLSAYNLGFDANDYIDNVPCDVVLEIHLAGHGEDGESALLIDSHAAPVADPVWDLFERLVARIGARPTIIERDDEIPPFNVLLGERARAQSVLDAAKGEAK